MRIIAAPADFITRLNFIAGILPSVPVLGLFVLGVRRSVKLVLLRSCLSIVAGMVSFIPYLVGLAWSGYVVAVVLFFPSRLQGTDPGGIQLGILFSITLGLVPEGIGYVFQELAQHVTKVASPES